MKLYIYTTTGNTWDDDDKWELEDEIEGETNEECEALAVDRGYGDTDIFAWSYTNKKS